MRRSWIPTLLVALAVVMIGCAKREEPAPAPAPQPAPAPAPAAAAAPAVASATLAPREGGTSAGTLTFTETAGGVEVVALISGAPPGPHGLHIHEVGDCSAADFTSAGGHFDPTDMPHGGPDDLERHAGDLGNIEIGADGSGSLTLTSGMLTVADGPSSVVGRGVILHEKADDLVSQPTGAAGARLACGVVERAS